MLVLLRRPWIAFQVTEYSNIDSKAGSPRWAFRGFIQSFQANTEILIHYSQPTPEFDVV
jgi:hypothetical protein